MTTNTQNLFDLISTFDNVARVAAMRGIAHSTMAKSIGAIRQDMRNRARDEQEDEADTGMTGLDQRNAKDIEALGVPEDVRTAFGFSEAVPPLKQASILHAVYATAADEVRTLAQSKWDYPMTVDKMLEFMIGKAEKLDPGMAKILAEAVGTDVATIEKMHELQNLREREQLKEAAPEIKLTFNGFGDNAYDDSIDDLPAMVQHQLGVKTVEALIRARERVVTRVMTTRRLTELSAIPVLKDAEAKVREWVDHFEATHEGDIREAIEAGRNIRTLDELTSTL